MSETDRLARIIRRTLLVLPFLWIASWYLPVAKDDTDPPSGRSGMRLLTDAKTGCQYLSRGGLTPRLDRDGKQICGH